MRILTVMLTLTALGINLLTVTILSKRRKEN